MNIYSNTTNSLSRKVISMTLILGLLISSLAFSASFPTLTTQAVGEGKWTDTDDNGIYKYVDFSPFEDANATEYIVSTAAQLAAVAALVNSYKGKPQAKRDANGSSANTTNFAGKKIQLTSDIDLEAHEWVPIGLANLHGVKMYGSNRINEKIDVFKGSFDGGNHTIENMKIGEKDTPAAYEYAGLFGHIGSSGLWGGNTNSRIDLEDCIIIIENINIGNGSHIYNSKSYNCTGGIAGYAEGATISNCSNSGEVHSKSEADDYKSDSLGLDPSSRAGGITCIASYGTQILNCSNAGDVSATVSNNSTSAGGIVEHMDRSTTIRNCSNSGNVSCKANESYVGGIAGNADGGTISNCSNSGNVSSTTYYYDSRVGGIVGSIDAHYTINISNCSNSGDVSAYDSYSYKSYAGGIIGKISTSFSRSEIQILKNCSNSGDVSAAAARRSYCYAGGIAGAIINVSCNISDTYYLKGTAAKGITNQEDQTGTTALTEDQMKTELVDLLNDWVNTNKVTNPDLLYWYQNDELNNGYPTLPLGNWIDYADTSWYTEDKAEYTISTAAELARLAVIVNEGRDDFAGKTITLAEDINLGAAKWIPIGTLDNPFRGIFDGANHTIKNMNIVMETSRFAGLFGHVNNGNISNINIDMGSSVKILNALSHAGGIVGAAYNSIVKNCNNKGRISSNSISASFLGGIIGYSENSTIINCNNSGKIEGAADSTSSTGGIVGKASETTIINSINSGIISALCKKSFSPFTIGGIAGSTNGANTKIINCNNSGEVSSQFIPADDQVTIPSNDWLDGLTTEAIQTGGIVGYAAGITISNCFNNGNISLGVENEDSYIGGIAGFSEGAMISNTYYLEGTAAKGIGDREDQTGTTALPEAQMKAANNSKVVPLGWIEIPIAENRRTSLVNALNIWVEQNREENPELLSWKQNKENNNGYPYPSEEGDQIELEDANNGWKQNNETLEWSYYENGIMVTAWKDIGDARYYFDEYGIMQKDWQYINGDWYYLYEEGSKVGQLARNDWDKGHDTEWYYVDKNGIMVTGWKDIGDATYYFDEVGKMASNWQVIGNEWYYFYEDDENGDNRRNGLLGKLAKNMWERGYNGEWYYADENGKMSINSWHTAYYNGIARLCFVGADGKMVKDDWRVDPNGNMRYLLSDGQMLEAVAGIQNEEGIYIYQDIFTGNILNYWKHFGNFWYYFENGIMVKDDWRVDPNRNMRYLFSDGNMLENIAGIPNEEGIYIYQDILTKTILDDKVLIGNDLYYFRNGQMVTNETIDGYQFGADGKALNYAPAA